MRTLALLFLSVGVALGQDALCATSQTAFIGALGRNACSLSCHAKVIYSFLIIKIKISALRLGQLRPADPELEHDDDEQFGWRL